MRVFTDEDIVTGLRSLVAPKSVICLVTHTLADNDVDQAYRAYDSLAECAKDLTGHVFRNIIATRKEKDDVIFNVRGESVVFTEDDTVDFFDLNLSTEFAAALPHLRSTVVTEEASEDSPHRSPKHSPKHSPRASRDSIVSKVKAVVDGATKKGSKSESDSESDDDGKSGSDSGSHSGSDSESELSEEKEQN